MHRDMDRRRADQKIINLPLGRQQIPATMRGFDQKASIATILPSSCPASSRA
ncbi:hypothetical protein [Paracoccus sp. DMF]|uniref:hypothetical protein n=1 Tax=Paracoccus sp. DMF TaxID=400837 RepID=UPI0021E48EF1|nr:hypothetical protein [Paracoccus sp. DMF]